MITLQPATGLLAVLKPQLEGMPILQGNSIKTQEYLFTILSHAT